MKRRKRADSESLKLITDALLAAGYWRDSVIGIDRVLIEAHTCPDCHCFLIYQGFSNADEYRAFGVCASCDYIRKFWIETAVVASFKKKFSPASVGAK